VPSVILKFNTISSSFLTSTKDILGALEFKCLLHVLYSFQNDPGREGIATRVKDQPLNYTKQNCHPKIYVDYVGVIKSSVTKNY